MSQQLYIALRLPSAEFGGKFVKPAPLYRPADIGHQFLIIMQIMCRQQYRTQHLLRLEKMVQIATTYTSDRRIITVRIKRPRVLRMSSVTNIQGPTPGESLACSTGPRRQNAIEHVYPALNRADVADGRSLANCLVASHNQASIEKTIAAMARLGLDPRGSKVYFGQLLGMADHLTFTLGARGYRAYKYVPYGPVYEVLPYLLRRAHENSDLLGGDNVATERALVLGELKRRMFGS